MVIRQTHYGRFSLCYGKDARNELLFTVVSNRRARIALLEHIEGSLRVKSEFASARDYDRVRVDGCFGGRFVLINSRGVAEYIYILDGNVIDLLRYLKRRFINQALCEIGAQVVRLVAEYNFDVLTLGIYVFQYFHRIVRKRVEALCGHIRVPAELIRKKREKRVEKNHGGYKHTCKCYGYTAVTETA